MAAQAEVAEQNVEEVAEEVAGSPEVHMNEISKRLSQVEKWTEQISKHLSHIERRFRAWVFLRAQPEAHSQKRISRFCNFCPRSCGSWDKNCRI